MSAKTNSEKLAAKGLAEYERADYSTAFGLFNAALEEDPSCARAWCGRGMIWHRQGDLVKAVSDYETAIRINDRYARAYFNRGVASLDQGDLEAALSDFNTAIDIEHEARFYFHRGMALDGLGRSVDAIKAFTDCIRLLSADDAAIAQLQSGSIEAGTGT